VILILCYDVQAFIVTIYYNDGDVGNDDDEDDISAGENNNNKKKRRKYIYVYSNNKVIDHEVIRRK